MAGSRKIAERFCLLPFSNDWWIEQICLTYPDVTAFVRTVLANDEDVFGTRFILAGKLVVKGAYVEPPLKQEVIDNLVHLGLEGHFPTQRQWALDLLVGMPSGDVAHEFLERLTSSDTMARRQACDILGRLQYVSRRILKGLLSSLSDPSRLVAESASRALGRLSRNHEEALLLLLSFLHDPNPSNRVEVVRALGHGKPYPEVLSALISKLKDTSDRVRAQAAMSLGTLGQSTEEITDALLDALFDESNVVAEKVTTALGRLELNQPVTDALFLCLRDAQMFMRGNAAKALAKAGTVDHKVLQQLMVCLEEGEPYVRGHALNTLKELLPRNPQFAQTLRDRLDDENDTVRWLAYWALAKTMSGTDLEDFLLESYSRERHDGIRSEIIAILGNEREPNARLVATLLDFLASERDATVRKSLLNVLAKWRYPSDEGREIMLTLLEDGVPTTREGAVQGLGISIARDQKAFLSVVHALKDESSEVRCMAARTLGEFGWTEPTVPSILAEHLGAEDPALTETLLTVFYEKDYVPEERHLLPLLESDKVEIRDFAFRLLFLQASRTGQTIAVEPDVTTQFLDPME